MGNMSTHKAGVTFVGFLLGDVLLDEMYKVQKDLQISKQGYKGVSTLRNLQGTCFIADP